MNQITIMPGDNRQSLASIPDNSIDSCVCDPPYGLVSITKRFGKDGAAPARKEKNDGSFARVSAGFMGRAWDGTGIENDPTFWAEVLRVLKPGAYIVAFSSSRTFHRMACAIEDAGFVTHPMIGWAYGQGFPKAHAADKAIDKLLGVDGAKGEVRGSSGSKRNSMAGDFTGGEYHNYIPGSPEAAQWQGWAYGGQVRKPALEPIYVGQKPFSEKSGAANILKWGVGAVNIDGCRVPTGGESLGGGVKPGAAHDGWQRPFMDDPEAVARWSEQKKAAQERNSSLGRHPANLIHDGSPEVVALFPDSKGQQAPVRGDEPSGVTKDIYGKFNGRVPAPVRNDSGSAARFFESYPFDGEPIFYHPKAGKEDRAAQFLEAGQQGHPTVKPIALMQALIRHVTPPGGTVLDPFAGSGTTGEAALREGFNCILMEAEPEYVGFLGRRFNQKVNEPENTSPHNFELLEYISLLGFTPR